MMVWTTPEGSGGVWEHPAAAQYTAGQADGEESSVAESGATGNDPRFTRACKIVSRTVVGTARLWTDIEASLSRQDFVGE
jgi:hypothetical protein